MFLKVCVNYVILENLNIMFCYFNGDFQLLFINFVIVVMKGGGVKIREEEL